MPCSRNIEAQANTKAASATSESRLNKALLSGNTITSEAPNAAADDTPRVKRAGQRVIEDGLHFCAGQRQRRAHQHRHQRIGQAHIPDDHPVRDIQGLRMQQPLEQLPQPHAGRAGGQVQQHAAQQRTADHQ
jgi:hypothetical protein